MSANEKFFNMLNKTDFLTLDEARKICPHPMMLSRLVAKGKLYRPQRKIYTATLDWLTDPLKKYLPVCTLIPDAIICGVSALTYYDLTDEEERQIWIAVPQKRRVINSEYRVIRPSGAAYSLGIDTHTFENRKVRIYNREKAVVDAFKYLTEEVALKALRAYMRSKNKNMDKLLDYSKKLKKPLGDIVRIMLSEE